MTSLPKPVTPAVPAPTHPRGRPALVVGILVAVMAGLFLLGLLPRLHQRAELLADTRRAQEERPQVRVVQPRHHGEQGSLVLPGSVEAVQDVPIYARANGYVRRRLVDIGDRVQAGQLLAEIDTPELDQEIAQAQAALGQAHAAVTQARATEALARATAARYEKMAAVSVASAQECEEKRAGAAVAAANLVAAEAAVRSGEANLARLRDLKGFSRVTAPFAGRITQRTTEVGTLIASGQTQPLYRLARTDPVRVFVHVPQIDASAITVGAEARFEARGVAGRFFTGKVTRTAGAVDVATRTMLTEMQIANPDGALLPGMYGQVSLPACRNSGALLIPSSALVFNGQGTQVLTIDQSERIRARPVRIEADYGTELAIAEGLDDTQRVVSNPGEGMADGTQVLVVARPSAPASPAASAGAPSR